MCMFVCVWDVYIIGFLCTGVRFPNCMFFLYCGARKHMMRDVVGMDKCSVTSSGSLDALIDQQCVESRKIPRTHNR